MANWTIDEIDRLFSASDFSLETDLKERLLRQIMPVKEISVDDLAKKSASGSKEVKSREHRTHERHASAAEKKDEAMNNDRSMLP